LRRKLNDALAQTYPAAQLIVLPVTRRLLTLNLKDRAPGSKNVVYQFDCSCGATYIGMTQWELSVRAKEHLPSWLIKNNPEKLRGEPDSSITRHLMTTGHKVDTKSCFRTIHAVNPS
ncbi:hypothetical protein Ciccas_014485, partial [Cichlidogyrus casuarinus]